MFVFHSMQTAKIFDHFPGGHAVVHGGIGRHKTDLAANHGGLRDHVVTVYRGGAAVGPQGGAENSQSRGFAGTVGPEQAINLSRESVEADAIERHKAPRCRSA